MLATVVVFPGSNADTEMIRTLRDVAGAPTTTVWHRETSLPEGTDLVALPGGFAYGDYLRCGAIARVSPIVESIRAHAARGGLVIGVCNGFQILTEIGLLPGALTRNAHLRFECRDIFVKTTAESPFTKGIPSVLRLPIAHAEGRYQADEATRKALEDGDRVAFRYCDRDGATTLAANPNGSIDNIAGVLGGPSKNVLGLMPHPERMSEPLLGGADGRTIFDAALRALAGGSWKAAS